jgi:hypothetical protein
MNSIVIDYLSMTPYCLFISPMPDESKGTVNHKCEDRENVGQLDKFQDVAFFIQRNETRHNMKFEENNDLWTALTYHPS